ncbi:alpha/beta fold hydrolase [Kribbella sp. CA-253562]|uniref:alpha/beta fold hydrolase n=1 Tax=Kribbella sp. CA-253562 TaxID=3239942 RepID=UPI003D8BE420
MPTFGTIQYDDSGRGDAVLLLPGWAGSAVEFGRLRAELDDGFRVVSADLPGSGRSGPQPREYSVDFYAEDARAFLALLDKLGIGAAHLVGFSDGGEVALLMAGLAPGRALSVLAWGAAGQIVEPVNGPSYDELERLIDEPVRELLPLAAYLAEAYGAANARTMARSWAGALRAITAAGGDVSLSRAAGISCPALLIAGSEDPFCPPYLVEKLAAQIPSARFELFEYANHDLHYSSPQRFTNTVVDWLTSH